MNIVKYAAAGKADVNDDVKRSLRKMADKNIKKEEKKAGKKDSMVQLRRVLDLYRKFEDGQVINKYEEAERYGVSDRTIQRDIDDLRTYMQEKEGSTETIEYKRDKKGYMVVNSDKEALTNSEIFAVCKILLESRSMVKEEMEPIIDKLVKRCVPVKNVRLVSELIKNEKYYYIEPNHGCKFMDKMWELGSAVYEHRLLRFSYSKMKDGGYEDVERLVQPVGIMFSEYYFYLIAFRCESEDTPDVKKYDNPTIFRLDRINEYEVLDRRFKVDYGNKFNKGQFRERVQFMFGGSLQRIELKCSGNTVEAVLDRFPTAEITGSDPEDGSCIVSAEVYGTGYDMWLNGQKGVELRAIEKRG